MNMIEEHRSVQEDGTLDLRGIIHIKEGEYDMNSSIKKVIIGSSVQTIETWAFSSCQNLEFADAFYLNGSFALYG